MPGMWAIPSLQRMGVLGGQLLACAGGHADHQRHVELTARHVQQGGGGVEDLVQGQEAEVDRHHLDNRTHAAQGRTDSRADKPDSHSGVSRMRSGPNSASSPLLTA